MLRFILALALLLPIPAFASGHHHRKPQVKAYERREEPSPTCLDTFRGVGTQWPTQSGAEEAAKKDWAETVRYDYGERFMDIDHAKDYRHACSRSSVGEIAGSVLYRCEVKARPCRAPLVETK